MGGTILRRVIYYLCALTVQIPLGLLFFVLLTSLGLVLPENLDTWVRRVLWLIFFFSGFWGAHRVWRLLLTIPPIHRYAEKHLGQGWLQKAWL